MRVRKVSFIPVSFASFLCPVCIKVVNKMSDTIHPAMCLLQMNELPNDNN